MPIDPKKFKEVVTNHFDNLAEEEFLETLHKSSPHLFNEVLEEKDKKDLGNNPIDMSMSGSIKVDLPEIDPIESELEYDMPMNLIVSSSSHINRIIALCSIAAVIFIIVSNIEIAIKLESILDFIAR